MDAKKEQLLRAFADNEGESISFLIKLLKEKEGKVQQKAGGDKIKEEPKESSGSEKPSDDQSDELKRLRELVEERDRELKAKEKEVKESDQKILSLKGKEVKKNESSDDQEKQKKESNVSRDKEQSEKYLEPIQPYSHDERKEMADQEEEKRMYESHPECFPISCLWCDVKFRDYYSIVNHVRMKHLDKLELCDSKPHLHSTRVSCLACDQCKYAPMSVYRAHMVEKHADGKGHLKPEAQLNCLACAVEKILLNFIVADGGKDQKQGDGEDEQEEDEEANVLDLRTMQQMMSNKKKGTPQFTYAPVVYMQVMYKCCDCNMFFTNDEGLSRVFVHMYQTHDKVIKQPGIVSRRKVRVSATNTDLKIRAMQKLAHSAFPCSFCTEKFSFAFALQLHIMNEHDADLIDCSNPAHKQTSAKEKKCLLCTMESILAKVLDSQKIMHSAGSKDLTKVYGCKLCGSYFLCSIATVIDHISNCREMAFKLPIDLADIEANIQHKYVMKKDWPTVSFIWECLWCPKTSDRFNGIFGHVTNVHGEKMQACKKSEENHPKSALCVLCHTTFKEQHAAQHIKVVHKSQVDEKLAVKTGSCLSCTSDAVVLANIQLATPSVPSDSEVLFGCHCGDRKPGPLLQQVIEHIISCRTYRMSSVTIKPKVIIKKKYKPPAKLPAKPAATKNASLAVRQKTSAPATKAAEAKPKPGEKKTISKLQQEQKKPFQSKKEVPAKLSQKPSHIASKAPMKPPSKATFKNQVAQSNPRSAGARWGQNKSFATIQNRNQALSSFEARSSGLTANMAQSLGRSNNFNAGSNLNKRSGITPLMADNTQRFAASHSSIFSGIDNGLAAARQRLMQQLSGRNTMMESNTVGNQFGLGGGNSGGGGKYDLMMQSGDGNNAMRYSQDTQQDVLLRERRNELFSSLQGQKQNLGGMNRSEQSMQQAYRDQQLSSSALREQPSFGTAQQKRSFGNNNFSSDGQQRRQDNSSSGYDDLQRELSQLAASRRKLESFKIGGGRSEGGGAYNDPYYPQGSRKRGSDLLDAPTSTYPEKRQLLEKRPYLDVDDREQRSTSSNVYDDLLRSVQDRSTIQSANPMSKVASYSSNNKGLMRTDNASNDDPYTRPPQSAWNKDKYILDSLLDKEQEVSPYGHRKLATSSGLLGDFVKTKSQDTSSGQYSAYASQSLDLLDRYDSRSSPRLTEREQLQATSSRFLDGSPQKRAYAEDVDLFNHGVASRSHISGGIRKELDSVLQTRRQDESLYGRSGSSLDSNIYSKGDLFSMSDSLASRDFAETKRQPQGELGCRMGEKTTLMRSVVSF